MELTTEILNGQIKTYMDNGGTITVYPTPRTRMEKKRPWMLVDVPDDGLHAKYSGQIIYSQQRRDFDQPAPDEIREMEKNDNGK